MSDCIVETIDGVRVIRFNRPERLNALGGTLMDEMNEAFNSGRDDDRVKAFVVTGEGRGWSAGADLVQQRGANENPRAVRMDPMGYHARTVLNIFGAIKPTIAAVNGVTVGGGFGFCSAFDFRIASEQARFSTVFIKRALAPDCGLSWFLPRLVGHEKAAEMFYTGRMVDAEEALKLGIVSKVVPHEKLMDEAMAFARELASKPPMALAYTKKSLQHSMSATLYDHLEYEWTIQKNCTSSAEFNEAVAAFREKREPDFSKF